MLGIHKVLHFLPLLKSGFKSTEVDGLNNKILLRKGGLI
jgi:hypothetical protein